MNKKALKKAGWSSMSKVVGIILATGAGTIVRDLVGDNIKRMGVCVALALTAWAITLYAEYRRELES